MKAPILLILLHGILGVGVAQTQSLGRWDDLRIALDRLDEVNVRRILKEGIDLNFTASGAGMPAHTVLGMFATRGDLDASKSVPLVELLLDHGADPNNGGMFESRPLINCVMSGHLEVAQLLVRRGADPNLAMVEGVTPLSMAIDTKKGGDRLPFLQFLLSVGADPNQPGRFGGYPLHIAAYLGKGRMVDELLKHGADIRRVNPESGYSVLHCAALEARPESAGVVRALLKAGADWRVKDHLQRTPLDVAVAKKNWAVVSVLKEAS